MKLPSLRLAEWFGLAGIFVSLVGMFVDAVFPPAREHFLGKLVTIVGAGLFGTGVVATMIRLRKFVETYEESALAGLRALQYGGAIGLIADARRSYGGGQYPHVSAGAMALDRYALEIIPDRARDLSRLTTGGRMILVEHHYINEYLRRLVECLPAGSTWLGVTRLTEGWLQRSAEPGYRDVVALIQDRCRERKLRVFRVYCTRTQGELDDLRPHLDVEIRSGIQVRAIVSGDAPPPDVTLLWKPTRDVPHGDQAEPGLILREPGAGPLCAMEFTTRAGVQIRQLDVYAPGSDHIEAIRTNFTDAWSRGAPVPAR